MKLLTLFVMKLPKGQSLSRRKIYCPMVNDIVRFVTKIFAVRQIIMLRSNYHVFKLCSVVNQFKNYHSNLLFVSLRDMITPMQDWRMIALRFALCMIIKFCKFDIKNLSHKLTEIFWQRELCQI